MSRTYLMATAASALVAVCSALAPQAAYAAEDEGRELEAVVVTATRREAKLQEVPISITVVGGAEVKRAAASRLDELQFALPNVVVNENSGAPGFVGVSIRGVSGRAGIYVDDVPIAQSSGFNTYLMDVERIEVLRGPQGTLFGTNTLAGTINTITRKPTSTFEAAGQVSYGNYESVAASGYMSGKLFEGVSLGVSATIRDREGFEKIRTGGRANDDGGWGARAKLRFQPNDQLDVTLALDTDYSNVHPFYYKQTIVYSGPTPATVDADLHNRIVDAGPYRNQSKRRIYGASLSAVYDLNGYTITSITAERQNAYDLRRDADYTADDRVQVFLNNYFHQFSHEFRIASPDEGRLTWIAGLFYLDTRAKSTQGNIRGRVSVFSPGVTVGQLQDLRQLPNPFITLSPSTVTDDTSYAAFGTADFKITEQLKLTGGLRYTHEKIRSRIYPTTEFEKSENNWSPSLSLSFQPTPQVNFYGTISQGWFRGGFNTQGVITVGTREFKPEKLINYEAGVKSTLLDGRLLANAAVYYLDYSNLQRTQGFTVNGVQTSTTTNASKSTVKGFELELQARPAEGLSLVARAGYQDATYDKYLNAPVFTTTGSQTIDLSGTDLPVAPKKSFSIQARYEHEVAAGWNGWISGDVAYKSQYQLNSGPPALVPFFVVPPSTMINASVGVTSPDERWTIGFYAKNIGKEFYKTGLDLASINGALVEVDQFNDPRTYLVQVGFKF